MKLAPRTDFDALPTPDPLALAKRPYPDAKYAEMAAEDAREFVQPDSAEFIRKLRAIDRSFCGAGRAR